MILNKIVEHKKKELEQLKKSLPLHELESGIEGLKAPLDFFQMAKDEDGLKIIAEVKKASPSKGIIRDDFEPVKIAKNFEESGAFAISVLTDNRFFSGSLEYLLEIKKNVNLPILRKDFTIDPYNIYEARYYGADVVLLIVSILETEQINEFLDLAHSLKLNAIVEVHDEPELDIALSCESKVIGINNRDLKTFKVNLSTAEKLCKKIPQDYLVISESGINSESDIKRLMNLGINTFLIGEILMKTDNPGEKLRDLISKVAK